MKTKKNNAKLKEQIRFVGVLIGLFLYIFLPIIGLKVEPNFSNGFEGYITAVAYYMLGIIFVPVQLISWEFNRTELYLIYLTLIYWIFPPILVFGWKDKHVGYAINLIVVVILLFIGLLGMVMGKTLGRY